MGQAFDDRGNVLGEAFGATKREVFDALNGQFKDAAEIRIRSLGGPGRPIPGGNAGASAEMPRYRSHKVVHALKIARVDFDLLRAANETWRATDGCAVITPADEGYAPFRVDHEYVRKHMTNCDDSYAGGYYVVYEDGYASFSPAHAFESGYTRL